MYLRYYWFFILVLAAAGCTSVPKPKPIPTGSLAAFQKKAEAFNEVVTVPTFETTPDAVAATATNVIAAGDAALDCIGRLKPGEVDFTNTIRVLDDIGYSIQTPENRLELIQQTSTNAAVRDAATDAIKKLNEWSVGIDYREDVYAAVKAYADSKPQLAGEDKKLLDETLRDYRRAGLELPKDQRDEVEKLRKQLTALETDFQNNVTKAKQPLKFTKSELEGVPGAFLAQAGIKTGPDEYTLMANITFHYLMVEDNAKREATRQRMMGGQGHRSGAQR